tara:strand:- start:202 stop:786 length:585 start_codon:yes stop_codon:yes gene_type:complete
MLNRSPESRLGGIRYVKEIPVALNLAQKKAIVAEISDVAQKSVAVVTADYRGLSANEMAELRKQARDQKVFIRIVRNTLAKRALKGTDFECIEDTLVGPTILAFCDDAPSAAARLIRDYAKKSDKLNVVSLAVGQNKYSAEQLEAVASLPTKDEAISKLLSAMQAPIAKFVRTVAAPHGKLVRTLAAVKDAKGA